jgi:UTP--glucose-1-phosphate uridylyltransferase
MKITKAVITAAGRDQHGLPLQRLVDRDGVTKSAIHIIIEEARSAGVEQIGLVIHPHTEEAYRAAVQPVLGQVRFIPQDQPLGYGHALWCARNFVGAEPFLHFVSDHLYISETGQRCAQQLAEVAAAENCAVSAVQATRENMLPYYGTVAGRRVAHRKNLYEIEDVVEKPTPTEAEQRLIVPGLRAGHYLCFFGMHVLTPVIMEILDAAVAAAGDRGGVQLSPALAKLAARERYLALELAGARYNIGVKYGLLTAQLALGLSGADRDEVLTQLVELLARQRPTRK